MKLSNKVRWLLVLPICLAAFVVEVIIVLNAVPGLDNDTGLLICAITAILFGIMVAPLQRLHGKRFLTVVTSLFILSCIFPPWRFTGSRRSPADFAFVFDPPRTSGVQIDFGSLFLMWSSLGAVTGLVLFLRKERKPDSRNADDTPRQT